MHCHHILTKGSRIELMLCPWGLIPLCWRCHAFAHDKNKEFMEWIEEIAPGRKEHLWQLSREWLKKPLEEIEEIYLQLGSAKNISFLEAIWPGVELDRL